jgi:hypothetical protein
VIVVTGKRADALARLDVFVGEWVMEARFPGDQPAPRCLRRFLGGGRPGPSARSNPPLPDRRDGKIIGTFADLVRQQA